jgi:hypothetical protein
MTTAKTKSPAYLALPVFGPGASFWRVIQTLTGAEISTHETYAQAAAEIAAMTEEDAAEPAAKWSPTGFSA